MDELIGETASEGQRFEDEIDLRFDPWKITTLRPRRGGHERLEPLRRATASRHNAVSESPTQNCPPLF